MVVWVVFFFGSLLQGVIVIFFVFIFVVGLNLVVGYFSVSCWYVEKISVLIIGVFGVYVIFCVL